MAQHNNVKSQRPLSGCPVIVALIVVQSPKPKPKLKPPAQRPKTPPQKAVTNQTRLRQKGDGMIWGRFADVDRKLIYNVNCKIENYVVITQFWRFSHWPKFMGPCTTDPLISHPHTCNVHIFNTRVEGASLWTLLGFACGFDGTARNRPSNSDMLPSLIS